jgi:aminoglycoside 6'-N-acetyltransferase I
MYRARLAGLADLDAVMALAMALWPDEPARGVRTHMRALLAGRPRSSLPLVIHVVERGRRVVGFIEVGLRSHAEGCDGRRPAGYVEGWFVVPGERGRGLGRRLMQAAERWAIDQGCVEMASDTWLDNQGSQRAHLALGFEEVERAVSFRKPLRRRARSPGAVKAGRPGGPTGRRRRARATTRSTPRGR